MTLHPERTYNAMKDVQAERERQDTKWGEQNHALPLWLAVLDEEVGEFATAILDKTFSKSKALGEADYRFLQCRKEAIQVAAVAVAIVEFIDRWTPK